MRRVPAKQFALCFAFFLMPVPVRAQRPSVIRIVPAANWRLVSSQQLDVNSVRRWGGDPAIEREYGVKSLQLQTYRLDNLVAEVVVEQAVDATSAYGLLTFYQTEAMAPEKTMRFTLSGTGGALMARSRLFIRVPRPAGTGGQLSDQDFRALLSVLGASRPPTEDMANLPNALPLVGLVQGSEKYLLGLEAARRLLPPFRTDLIGFSQGAEVQMADYWAGKQRVTVLAINYPTPQIARARLGTMENLLHVNQDHGAGSIYGRRMGSFVIMVLGSDSPTAAAMLMDEFKNSERVSWDERYPGDKPVVVQMLELIVANLIFVFILVGFAVVGGITIYLSRRVAKRWFPQSHWGQPDEATIIRLNLT